jgi:peptide/nickel transport system substrate-binding protein
MSVQTGTYDTVICWDEGKGPGPYYLYAAAYAPSGSAREIGESAASGYARYTHPDITKALNDFTKTSDAGEQKAAIDVIVRRVTQDVPLIPLVSRWRTNMYSTQRFVGWPDDDNPYTAGKNIDADIGYLLLINVRKR